MKILHHLFWKVLLQRFITQAGLEGMAAFFGILQDTEEIAWQPASNWRKVAPSG